MKPYTQSIKVISLSLILSFGVSFVSAWTGPTKPPPPDPTAVNASAPINTSADTQIKTGALGVEGLFRAYSWVIGYSGVIGLDNPGNTSSFSRWIGQLGAGDTVGSSSGFVGLEVESIPDGNQVNNPPPAVKGPEQKLHLWTHRSGVLNSRALTIDGAGNVGVGTVTPATKLEIVGGITKTTGGLIIETRASDPTTDLVDGRMWLII